MPSIASEASTLNVQLKNQTSSNTVYAYFTGYASDHNNDLFLLQADGQTPYYPAYPPSNLSPLAEDCAIPLGAPGSTCTVTIPKIFSARIYFSVDNKMTFLLNQTDTGKAALVEPSVSNPSDPQYDIKWDFCELTFDNTQLFCNITYVDFVSLPIQLTLTTTTGPTQYVAGIPATGLADIYTKLQAQQNADNQPWTQLLHSANGQQVRILSPNNGIKLQSSLFSGYFEDYITQVWQEYTPSQTLSIDTQNAGWGTLQGSVDPSTGLLTFLSANAPNGRYTFAKPCTADIFNCSSGPFNLPNDESGNIGARIAAGFNRTTILAYKDQPDQPAASDYYMSNPTNHYSRIVHAENIDKLGYAFPYDDVTPTGGQDQSGKVASPDPVTFTVAVGATVNTPAKGEL